VHIAVNRRGPPQLHAPVQSNNNIWQIRRQEPQIIHTAVVAAPTSGASTITYAHTLQPECINRVHTLFTWRYDGPV